MPLRRLSSATDEEMKQVPPDAEAASPPPQEPAAAAAAPTVSTTYLQVWSEKARGVGQQHVPPRRVLVEALVDGLFACLGIALLAGIHEVAMRRNLSQLVASFGATAVLIFAAPTRQATAAVAERLDWSELSAQLSSDDAKREVS